MEILQADSCYNFGNLSQRRSQGLQRHCIARLPDPLFKNHSVKFLAIEENTRKPYLDKLCLFTTLALHFHENQRLEEETFKLVKLIHEKVSGTDPANFRDFSMEDFAAVESSFRQILSCTIMT